MKNYDQMHSEVTSSILVCGRRWVDERSTSRIERIRLTWLFARATLSAAGVLFHDVLDMPPQDIATSPVVRCMEAYCSLARKRDTQ